MPSTLMNIVDLIADYKTVVKNNDYISYAYILYQSGMMLGTLIGPGSIFHMLLPIPGEAKAKAMPGRLYIHTK